MRVAESGERSRVGWGVNKRESRAEVRRVVGGRAARVIIGDICLTDGFCSCVVLFLEELRLRVYDAVAGKGPTGFM